MRDYLAGTTSTSIATMYKAGRREMYGVRLPDGLRENQKLPQTILTPTSKAEQGGHDEPLSPADIFARGLLTPVQWDELSALALAVFARGRSMARERGLILADTKYEFGVTEEGRILLADEVHTPDSSRYWFAHSYEARLAAGERPESFDKDFVRTWVSARCDPYNDPIPEIPREIVLEAARIYIELYEAITSEAFALPDPAIPVLQRIRANLARYFTR